MNADVIHRLGATMCAAVGALCLAAAVGAWRQRRRTLRRLVAVVGGGSSGTDRVAAASVPGTGPGAAPGAGVPRGAARLGVLGGVVRVGVPRGAETGGSHRPEDKSGGRRRVDEKGRHPEGRKKQRPRRLVRGAVRRWLLAAGAVCAGYALVGGVLGGLLGMLCGGGVWWWQSRPVPVEEFDAARAVRELPLAADLLAACIAAGADPVTAARVVGESLEGPVGRRLAWGAAELRLGGEPAEAWRRLASVPGARHLARLLERAGDSGAPAAAPVARLAAEARAERGRSATTTARRAAVLITAPVGLCFLPAFITVGVVPILIGLAGGLLGGGGR